MTFIARYLLSALSIMPVAWELDLSATQMGPENEVMYCLQPTLMAPCFDGQDLTTHGRLLLNDGYKDIRTGMSEVNLAANDFSGDVPIDECLHWMNVPDCYRLG
ncbi:hypothetical protein, partial [Photobacterium sp. R1]